MWPRKEIEFEITYIDNLGRPRKGKRIKRYSFETAKKFAESYHMGKLVSYGDYVKKINK